MVYERERKGRREKDKKNEVDEKPGQHNLEVSGLLGVETRSSERERQRLGRFGAAP